MIEAIEKMSFADDVDTKLKNRINQHLGMGLDSAEVMADRKIWLGTIALKQAVPGKDEEGVFRPCLKSWDYTQTECDYVDPSQSYKWARDWAAASWEVDGKDAFPWTGKGYTFDWGKNFEYAGIEDDREDAVGSQ